MTSPSRQPQRPSSLSRRSAFGVGTAGLLAFGAAACSGRADDAAPSESPVATESTAAGTTLTRRPLVAAHRGNSGACPENTAAAFSSAWAAGSDLLEIDMQRSADGVAVAIHDAILDRTTSGTGPVAEYTAAQLRELDAGSWFSPGFAGQRIPFVEDVIAAITEVEGRGAVVELKDEWPEKDIAPVIEAFAAGGVLDRVTIQSFSADTLRRVRDLSPDIEIAVLEEEIRERQLELAAEVSASAVIARGWFLLGADRALSTIRDAGLQAMAWSTDDPAEWEALALGEVDVIMTNRPDRLNGWLGGRFPQLASDEAAA